MTSNALRLVGKIDNAVAIDNEDDASRSLTCPLCHTPASLSRSAVEAGGTWRCIRCSQQWDAGRLTASAAYAVWAAERKAGRPDARRAWSFAPPAQ
jgi:hypothetical protein